jgi:hypothetical protein
MHYCVALQEEAQQRPGKVVKINRAPVLTLWVKTVAEREGYAGSVRVLACQQDASVCSACLHADTFRAGLQLHDYTCEFAVMMRVRR